MRIINVIFLFFLISSCSTEKNQSLLIDDLRLDKTESSEIVENLEKNLNAAYPDTKIIFEATNLKKIGNSYYLVARGDGYVSTTLLKKGNNNTLVSAGISCTSKSCASTSGCIPKADGKSCTTCKGGAGDCTKTVTQEEETLQDS